MVDWSEDLRKYDPRTEKNINRKASFLENMENFYNGREMVINGFKNKIIPLAGGSYFQYFEGEDKVEPDIYWVQKSEKFIEFTDYLKNEVEEGFNVNFGKNAQKSKILVYLR